MPGLGPLESAILIVLWDAAGPLTGRAVLERLDYRVQGGGRPAYSTVMTVVTILWRKGLLTRARLSGHGGPRAWWYRTCISRDEYLAAVICNALGCASDPAALATRAFQTLPGSHRRPVHPETPEVPSPPGPSARSTAQRWITTLDGHRLRQLRRQRGLSQASLAALAGISQATVARLELRPAVPCRGRTLARLAAALGEPPATLTPQQP